MRKLGYILLTIVLLFSTFPVNILGNEPLSQSSITYENHESSDFDSINDQASVTDAVYLNVDHFEQNLELSIAEQKKQQLAKNFAVAEEELQSLLDRGYTLSEVEEALHKAESEYISLDQALSLVSKEILNLSDVEESEIVDKTDEYADPMTSAQKAELESYRKWMREQIAAGLMSVPELPKIHVNPNPDAAPYSIDFQNESISTLSGNLTITVTDMLLPGNLPFELTRTYNSSDAQYYDFLPAWSVYDYLEFFNATDYKKSVIPLGTGWSFNIPFIETKYYDDDERYPMGTYLNWIDGGKYEIKESDWGSIYLLGFPYELQLRVEKSGYYYNVTTLEGIKYQFNYDGNPSNITDPYGNQIDFQYTYDSTLKEDIIKRIVTRRDRTVNQDYLEFNYSTNQVTVQKYIDQQLKETVTYKKQNVARQIDVLTRVTDQAGRQTTYSYEIKNARFTFSDSNLYPEDNPYALLTKIVHPTGAISEYTYPTYAHKMSIGYDAYNQVYQVAERKDRIQYTNGTSEIFNHTTFSYGSKGIGSYTDFGREYIFTTTVNDGLSVTQYDYKSKPDNNWYDFYPQIPVYFNIKTVRTAGNLESTYDYTYNESLNFPTPTQVKTRHRNKSTGQLSEIVTQSYRYNWAGDLLSETNADGITTSYTYTSGLPKSITQPVSGTLSQYTDYTRNTERDITRVVIRENNASGKLMHQADYDYDTYGNLTKVSYIEPNRQIVQNISYSSAYHYRYPTQISVQTTNADGQTSTAATKAEYDPRLMQITSITDGENNKTRFEYDILGRMTKMIHPDNSNVQYIYNDSQNIIQRIGETGIKTETRFNPLGWQTQTGIYKGSQYQAKSKQGYDAWGRLAWEEDAVGNRTTYTYYNRPWGEEIVTMHPDGSTTSIKTNVINRTETATDEEGNNIITTFDKLGRAIKIEEKIGTVTTTLETNTYNHLDQVVSAKDANNKTTQYAYDALGQLIRVTNPLNEQTRYEYDRMGNLTKVTYPDNATLRYEYDQLGRTIKRIDPSNKIDKYYYDKNGNLTKHVNRKGQTTNYTYSNRQFLLSQIGPMQSVTFAYNTDGTQNQMTDVTGTTRYTYDSNTGELTRITYPDNKTLNYTYNANGQRASLTGPFGQQQTFQYDSRNRLYRVKC